MGDSHECFFVLSFHLLIVSMRHHVLPRIGSWPMSMLCFGLHWRDCIHIIFGHTLYRNSHEGRLQTIVIRIYQNNHTLEISLPNDRISIRWPLVIVEIRNACPPYRENAIETKG